MAKKASSFSDKKNPEEAEPYLALFKMPTALKITGRSSSITNVFVNAILPTIMPTESEVREALDILGMTRENFQCAYCGDTASEWDHLNPLVVDKKPTGFITEINNLVPSCGKCNQSKGNKDWKVWIESAAKLSPRTRGIRDLSNRIERLTAYEKVKKPKKLNVEEIAGVELWNAHMANLRQVLRAMSTAQELATTIAAKISSVHSTDEIGAKR
jgi:hypothetical protein